MLNPEDIARLITEDPDISEVHTLYKGVSLFSGYAQYEHDVGESGVTIPGFLSTYHIGRVYSEPTLTGDSDDPSIIISVEIDPSEVEDRTEEFMEWADARGQEHDISLGYPKEWRTDGSVWTIGLKSSAHGGVSCFSKNDFVYCGAKKPYAVIRHYNNQEEWEADS